MKTAFVFLADGFEEVEAFIPIDLMVRADIAVHRVGVFAKEVLSNSGSRILADTTLDELDAPTQDDVLVLPGGSKGAKNLSASSKLIELLNMHNSQRGVIAAICIAPAWVLGQHGFLAGKKYTCYPGGESDVSDSSAIWVDAPVVRDGNIISSRGVGTAAQFAAVLISILVGIERAKQVWHETLQNMTSTTFPENI